MRGFYTDHAGFVKPGPVCYSQGMKKNRRGLYSVQVHIDEALARALTRYHLESGRTYTGIVRIALRRAIPARFFVEEDAEPERDTAA